jgi:creatinine amidohydrolase
MYQDGVIETNTELHSGEVETSQMLYLAPETVHMDRAVDFVPDVPRNYLNYGSMFRATPTGVWGEPSYGTAEKGERIFAHCADQAVQQINHIFAYMEKKEKFNYSYF